MKTRIFLLIPLVCAALVALQGAEPTTANNTAKYWAPNSKATGRLIVQRSSSFGKWVGLRLWIDGKVTKTIEQGEHFDGMLPTGDHVLAVRPVPDTHFGQATSVRVTVQPGQTYAFTAVHDSDQLVLRRSALSPPR